MARRACGKSWGEWDATDSGTVFVAGLGGSASFRAAGFAIVEDDGGRLASFASWWWL